MSQENVAGETSSPEIRTDGTPPPSATPPPRRGPGRPRKDGLPPGGGAALGETAIPAGEGASKRGQRKTRVELDRVAIARQLLGSHMMVASMLGLPELMLTEKEADSEAEAICDFAREYDFEPDPKIMASINLIATMGFIYVPKVMKIAARVKQAKRAAKGQTIDGEATEVKPNGAATSTPN